MKQKTGRKLLGVLLTLAMVVGLMPGMSLTAYAAPTETLLTTITGAGSNTNPATSANVSYSTGGVATLTFSKPTSDGQVAYQASPAWGWWGYAITLTVTPAEGYTITKCVFYDDKDRTATDSEAPFVVETTVEDKTPKVNGTPILAYTSKGIKKIEVYGYATPAATHSVTITAGDHMTKTADSGEASQTDLTGAMTDVVYTADNGYYYPTDYSVAEVSGIKVTRDSYTQITVSGTPTADAEITLTAPTAKTTPDAPTAAATDCTTADNNDGKLTGVTADMEYKLSTDENWTDGTGDDVTGLVPGTYFVRFKETNSANASGNQTLTIASLISITKQPESLSVHTGDAVSFEVTSEEENLTYQWQTLKTGEEEWVNSGLAGNKTNKLRLTATNARNGYKFRCVITDEFGTETISEEAELTVVKPVVIKTQPKDAEAEVGTTAKFTVKLKSGEVASYQWQVLRPGEEEWLDSAFSGNKTTTFRVPATKGRNGYKVRLKITDVYGMVTYSEEATLTIASETVIETQPETVSAEIGETAVFSVKASSTAGFKLTYQWQTLKTGKEEWVNSSFAGNKTANLKVPVTKGRYGYQFRCVITDPNGNETISEAVELTEVLYE